MNERIIKNEERLDSVLSSIKKLEDALTEFKSNEKNIYLLNRYYGSNNWFKDKEVYEKNNMKLKAGVLSEDAIWNMLDDVDDLIFEMKKIVKKYSK